LVEIQPLDAEVAGLLRTKSATIVLRVQTDGLDANRLAEGVLSRGHGVFVDALCGGEIGRRPNRDQGGSRCNPGGARSGMLCHECRDPFKVLPALETHGETQVS
jgi:hypothetical protein